MILQDYERNAFEMVPFFCNLAKSFSVNVLRSFITKSHSYTTKIRPFKVHPRPRKDVPRPLKKEETRPHRTEPQSMPHIIEGRDILNIM